MREDDFCGELVQIPQQESLLLGAIAWMCFGFVIGAIILTFLL